MPAYSCMYVIPQTLYNNLLEGGDQRTRDSLTAHNIRQLNNLRVEDGGKVTINANDRGQNVSPNSNVRIVSPVDGGVPLPNVPDEQSEGDGDSNCGSRVDKGPARADFDDEGSLIDDGVSTLAGSEEETHPKTLLPHTQDIGTQFVPQTKDFGTQFVPQTKDSGTQTVRPSLQSSGTQTVRPSLQSSGILGKTNIPAKYPSLDISNIRDDNTDIPPSRPSLQLSGIREQTDIPPRQSKLASLKRDIGIQFEDVSPISVPDRAVQHVPTPDVFLPEDLPSGDPIVTFPPDEIEPPREEMAMDTADIAAFDESLEEQPTTSTGRASALKKISSASKKIKHFPKLKKGKKLIVRQQPIVPIATNVPPDDFPMQEEESNYPIVPRTPNTNLIRKPKGVRVHRSSPYYLSPRRIPAGISSLPSVPAIEHVTEPPQLAIEYQAPTWIEPQNLNVASDIFAPSSPSTSSRRMKRVLESTNGGEKEKKSKKKMPEEEEEEEYDMQPVEDEFEPEEWENAGGRRQNVITPPPSSPARKNKAPTWIDPSSLQKRGEKRQSLVKIDPIHPKKKKKIIHVPRIKVTLPDEDVEMIEDLPKNLPKKRGRGRPPKKK